MRNPALLLSTGALALLGGCTMMPEPVQPQAAIPARWEQTPETAPAGAQVPAWEDFFQDENLRKLIALALENNRDLRIATLRVEQVRAQYQIQWAQSLPQVSGNTGTSRSRTPGDLSGTGEARTSNRFELNASVAAWELDLFGRIRSLNTQALETYFGQVENQAAAELSLVSTVADQYFALLAATEQHRLAGRTLRVVERSHEIMVKRHELGDAALLDLRTTEAQVENARLAMARSAQSVDTARHALDLLIGAPIPKELLAADKLPSAEKLRPLTAGLPSALIYRRPDIRAAEHQLRAAEANIGAARAAFFPSIRLTASGGTASSELDGLFGSGSGAWSFAPRISVPIFAGGANRARLEAANVGRDLQVAQYEKSIQNAFREVADALSSRRWIAAQLNAARTLVAAHLDRFDLAQKRYDAGVDGYLVVLTAQQDLFQAEQTLVQLRQTELSNRLALYRALGGGWSQPDLLVVSSAATRHVFGE